MTAIKAAAASVRCAKCGIQQDPEHPLCVHLLTAKAGRAGGRALAAKYGTELHAAAGRKGARIRWAKAHGSDR